MSRIYDDITKTVGNTPLVRLNRLTAGLEAVVLVKTGVLQSLIQCKGSHRGGDD